MIPEPGNVGTVLSKGAGNVSHCHSWITSLSKHFLKANCYTSFLMAQQVKNLPANAGDVGSIPGLGRYPGEGNGNPLQYSSLDNPMDRGAWQATVMGSQKSWTQLIK